MTDTPAAELAEPAMEPDAEGLRRMLNVEGVLELIPVSRTTLFRMEKARTFPPSRSISPGRRAWYEDEVLAWQKALPVNHRVSKRSQRATG